MNSMVMVKGSEIKYEQLSKLIQYEVYNIAYEHEVGSYCH